MFEMTAPGQTPLDEEDRTGLKLAISTRGDLDRAEFENIANAEIWASVRSRPISTKQILREAWLKDLHGRMFGAVWSWAGTYRRRQTNLGCPPYEIPTQMADSLAYADVWISQFQSGGMTADEVAVRFAHKIVCVHPFPNGNGRWSRMVGDLFVQSLGQPRFTWGRGDLVNPGDLRDSYLGALNRADLMDMADLIAFARA
ncbi:MAG: mobile mystery protein B [Candidatus Nanopelagicales bacterium]